MGMLALDISAFAPDEITSGMWAEAYGQHQPLEQLAAAAGVAANTLLVGTGTTAMRQYMSSHFGQEPLT